MPNWGQGARKQNSHLCQMTLTSNLKPSGERFQFSAVCETLTRTSRVQQLVGQPQPSLVLILACSVATPLLWHFKTCLFTYFDIIPMVKFWHQQSNQTLVYSQLAARREITDPFVYPAFATVFAETCSECDYHLNRLASKGGSKTCWSISVLIGVQ